MRGAIRALVLAAGVLAAAGVVVWSQPHWLLDAIAERYPGCAYRFRTDLPAIALTIDDGPDRETPLILEELRRHSAQATFFPLASRAGDHDAVMERIVREGHEIGNHGLYDRAAVRLPIGEFARDLAAAGSTLARFGPVRWARPGSGWYTQGMIAAMRRAGNRCALGSVYPFDAAIPSVRIARGHVLANVRPGSIVVLHDGGTRGRRTLEVLRRVLPELRRRGYRVVTLSELAALATGRDAVQRNVPGLTSYTR